MTQGKTIDYSTRLEALLKEEQMSQDKKAKALEEVKSVLNKHYPPEKNDHDVTEVLAEMLCHYDHKDEAEVSLYNFYFDRSVQTYLISKLNTCIPTLLKIYEYLEQNGHVRDNDFDTNDLGDRWFYIKNADGKKIFSVSTQNFRFLVILVPSEYSVEFREKFGGKPWKVHIRRYWKSLDSEEVQGYKEEFEKNPTLEHALSCVE